ncbi:hypothetical protein DL240_07050 [Lujinxingia litoralis]|uniref:Protein kinase domain-containing protein n=1 Tax=Lujinxingia litoralis TaxID=2211119 RepID=A0A328CAD6_9DELT|nr:serine/threonine-protein kinase [Lujinxingia litoralis]RAL23898.1 hypothetical protein DL240_07050 [Lujinxingia litoralis]
MALMPVAGDIVDDVFRVEEEIDSGNFGAVYKVRDLLEHRTLALKVLKPGPHDENELRQRFEREASLIYSLRHPHVVQVYYYGQTQSGLPYMAMEYLQGTDLRSLLAHHGGLSEALARRITIEALAALHAAHATDIVHRDLKPANIFLVNDGDRGHVKVLDFGFAKALDGDTNFEITNAGTLVGTPAYMSPELVHKKNVGPQADIYALGLILAEMLTGEKVVDIANVYDTIVYQGSKKDIKLPRELKHSIFAPIIEKAIAKDLDRRYVSAIEMIDALRALQIEGVGGYTDDVPLTSAPPALGNADPAAHTRPRSDGRPTLIEVEQELADASTHHLMFDHEPTIDLPRDREAPRHHATAQMPAISRSTAEQLPAATRSITATMATALPDPPAEKERPAWVDVLSGILVGGIALAAIIYWLG